MFKKLTQKTIYQDNWLKFFQDEIEFPDGSAGTYAWTQRKNGVAVVVVNSANQILLHKEYRYVIKDFSWEIQGGGIDERESAEVAAVRELEEEAGLAVPVSGLQKLGVFYPLNSFNTESITLFMTQLTDGEVNTTGQESGEAIANQRFVNFTEALAMIDEGQINDAFTANAIQMVVRKLS